MFRKIITNQYDARTNFLLRSPALIKKLFRNHGVDLNDYDDLYQDVIVNSLTCKFDYDPKKSKMTTYAGFIVHITVLQWRTRRKKCAMVCQSGYGGLIESNMFEQIHQARLVKQLAYIECYLDAHSWRLINDYVSAGSYVKGAKMYNICPRTFFKRVKQVFRYIKEDLDL